MNASYNALVKEYLPQAEIVYDRYHVQAQFGRDVLGKVRLDAARSHKEAAKKMCADGESKQQIQQEKKLYSKVKKARWMPVFAISFSFSLTSGFCPCRVVLYTQIYKEPEERQTNEGYSVPSAWRTQENINQTQKKSLPISMIIPTRIPSKI